MAEFTYKWLVWDGRYTLKGRCNQVRESEPTSEGNKSVLLPRLQIPRKQDVKQPPSIIAATAVSVRLLRIVESSANKMAIKVQLKRLKKADGSWNIKSLMLRIYRNYDSTKDKDSLPPEKLVYQEILSKEEIEQLANAQKEEDTGIPTEPNPLLAWAEGAFNIDGTEVDSPYKVRVWVSTSKNAFGREDEDLLPFTDEPETRYTVQVHDQYKPTEAEFQKRFEQVKGDRNWSEFSNKRKEKEKTGKYEDLAGKNVTSLSYRTFMAPAAEISLVAETLKEAARLGVPFTEGLMAVAKADLG